MNSIRDQLELQILLVLPEAVSALAEISRKTFHETFMAVNDERNMQQYLSVAFSEQRLLEELAMDTSEFYFAMLYGNIVGYIKLNTENNTGLEIERIYVRSIDHGKGIGKALMQFALNNALEKGINRVWLGVASDNKRALEFYQSFGFVNSGEKLFKLGEELQVDIMMEYFVNTMSIESSAD